MNIIFLISSYNEHLPPASIGRRVFVSTIWGRRKRQGAPHLNCKDHRGEKLVLVNVDIPTKLTKEQRELFEQLAASVTTAVKPIERGLLAWMNEALGG